MHDDTHNPMRLMLGIETSCDETAVALVSMDDTLPEGPGHVLASLVSSQVEDHAVYGGVVPELAARAHISKLDGMVRQTVKEASINLNDIDGVAATAGPGLIGGVIVGLVSGKALASSLDVPFFGINHLEGHALTVRMTHGTVFPYLLLLVSGGHTQILIAHDVGVYERLGTTLDDALGEAFDKTAKLLSLGFPGGPLVEKAAQKGNRNRFDLPKPMLRREGCDFSFAGLKTALRQTAETLQPLSDETIYDLCASFEATICDVICDRVEHALVMFEQRTGQKGPLVVAGGVASNQSVRIVLEQCARTAGTTLVAPPVRYCSDNAAMIAWAGLERLYRKEVSDLSMPARPRWPLDSMAEPAVGSGKRGAKV